MGLRQMVWDLRPKLRWQELLLVLWNAERTTWEHQNNAWERRTKKHSPQEGNKTCHSAQRVQFDQNQAESVADTGEDIQVRPHKVHTHFKQEEAGLY